MIRRIRGTRQREIGIIKPSIRLIYFTSVLKTASQTATISFPISSICIYEGEGEQIGV